MGDKTYVVVRSFTDTKGRTWTQGQAYTNDDAQDQVDNGNVAEGNPGQGQGGQGQGERPTTPPGQEGEQPGNRPDQPPGQDEQPGGRPQVEPRR